MTHPSCTFQTYDFLSSKIPLLSHLFFFSLCLSFWNFVRIRILFSSLIHFEADSFKESLIIKSNPHTSLLLPKFCFAADLLRFLRIIIHRKRKVLEFRLHCCQIKVQGSKRKRDLEYREKGK